MSKASSTTNMLMQPGDPRMVEQDVSKDECEGSLLSSTIATAAAAAMGADGSTTADCRKECDRVSIGDLCVTVYVLHLIYRK